MGRFLEFFRPIAPFVPEVKTPERKVSFNRKLMWTGIALICYLIMAETPLYGVNVSQSQAQQMAAYRVIFASTAGTLLELGIGPIVTAGLIIQLLAGSDLIGFDNTNPEDRALFTTVSKIFSFLMIAFQSGAYIITGQYGRLTLATATIIFFKVRVRYGNQCARFGSLPGSSLATLDSFDVDTSRRTPSHERLAIAAASGLTKFGTAFSVVSSSDTSKRVPRASTRDGGLSTPQYLRAVR